MQSSNNFYTQLLTLPDITTSYYLIIALPTTILGGNEAWQFHP
jgi:hypothetical protein